MKEKVKVAIIGFGTVGKRIADAVRAQDDMQVAGIVKKSPSAELYPAIQKGYGIYAINDESRADFNKAGFEVSGDLSSLLEKSDIAIVATPDDTAEEYIKICKQYGLPVIIQGGEDHELSGISFNSEANYYDAWEKEVVRVVSCNTTALVRALYPLNRKFGIEKVRATLIRRAADPNDSKKGPINALVPEVEIPSHHGPDVNTILPELDITTVAAKASTTLMHLHALNIKLEKSCTEEDIIDLYESRPRIRLVSSKQKIKSTADIMELARDMGRPRGDMWENSIWKDSIRFNKGELYFFEAVHQESIVVPENVDAIRSMLGLEPGELASIAKTNKAMGIER
ncbi:MAG: type II glyceraldehyde-3-phosphate dehydrogenase [Minisyncoccia bacterium]